MAIGSAQHTQAHRQTAATTMTAAAVAVAVDSWNSDRKLMHNTVQTLDMAVEVFGLAGLLL